MEKLEQKVWDACLGIVKHQGFRLMIIRNFGELGVWIVDDFSSKGIGQNYNEITGRNITPYIRNIDFYSPGNKSIMEQAQGAPTVTMKFGHDEYIWILNVV
jgi:hypothetical protein